MKQEQLKQMKDKVTRRFDSNKNWSIMMDHEDNEIRNSAMQRIKFQQLKRRTLHDFMRVAKNDLVKA
eukprot:CAMPEP_0170509328 /NCGR_PEP_ID=MMETSP0208-20121228/65135_1 /TAXON_ID=197538 /ORGANISM="Strombidium inclinatum, Strain S3" /LENGTH=66 /DNA_ID=CAMNT_0010792671 /DNA_START=6 /DNA_END=203 /DNA_ORIENTATION=-